MNVLVTGATGFVGRALVARLAGTPAHRVRAAARREVADLAPGVEQIVVPDLGASGDWGPALDGVNAVVHLAARVHVMSDSAADPLEAYRRVNTRGTLDVARQAAEHGVRRFVFVSSVKVNGEETAPGRPFTEQDAPRPTDPYGISKAEAEGALLAFGKERGMEIVVVRPTLVYGPGAQANFLAMVRWIARGVPLPLGALTENRRSLVALDNLIDLLSLSLVHKAAAGEVFFAADGEDLSTAELIRRTAAAMGKRALLIPVPRPLLALGAGIVGRGAVWQRLNSSLQVDTAKARRVLGWTPPVSVDEGLRRAVAGSRA